MSNPSETPIDLQTARDRLHVVASQSSEQLGGHALTAQQFSLCMDAYNHPSRKYHDTGHAQNMASVSPRELEAFGRDLGDDAAARKLSHAITLGGLYHDLVYTQVDGGVTPAIAAILQKYTSQKDGVYTLRADMQGRDKQVFDIVSGLFGVQAGETLPIPSQRPQQNELLSALAAVDQMAENGHNAKTLIQIAAVIEGTIPFRDEKHFDRLADRVRQTNASLGAQMTDTEIDQTVKAAVFAANKDVLAFAGDMKDTLKERFLKFAKGTWQLIPESNASYGGAYCPADYRKTMKSSQFFFTKVLTQPDKQIFHQYQHYPPDEVFARMQANEREVRDVSDIYFQAKTVSAALVEAVAAIAAPAASLKEMVEGNEAYLPKPPEAQARYASGAFMSPQAQVAQDVLRNGRGDAPGFDISASPMAAYIHPQVGQDGLKRLFDSAATNFKAGAENPAAFLDDMKTEMGPAFNPLIRGLAEVAKKSGNTERAREIEALSMGSWAESLKERSGARTLP